MSMVLSTSVFAKKGFIVSPDAKIKAEYNDNVIKVIDNQNGKLLYTINKELNNVQFVVLNIDSTLLASYDSALNRISIWDIKSGKLIHKIDLVENKIKSLLFHDYQQAIVVQYQDGMFQSFNIERDKKSDDEEGLINSQGEDSQGTNSQAFASVEKEFITLDVMYGTNRGKTGYKEPNEFFGKTLGKLQYGICQVSIPITHKTGEIERPDWFKFEFKEDPRKHIMIQTLKELKKSDFNTIMKDQFSKMGKTDILIFIHGFSNRFDEAVRRTGQMAYDLDFPGIAMTYSWPSQGAFSLSNYKQDEKFAKYSIKYLKEFLLNVVKNSKGQRINIIAHSMGNRVLTNAIADIQNQSNETIFNQVILAAPDVNAKLFKEEILPKMKGKANKITLYASSEDKALQSSRILHNQSRLGESGKYITVADGMDTIDSTGVDPSTLGHAYYSSTQTLLEDIKKLMLKDVPPSNRKLKVIKEKQISYWEMIFENILGDK
jgi:esterase/lipase superfamily enzyme